MMKPAKPFRPAFRHAGAALAAMLLLAACSSHDNAEERETVDNSAGSSDRTPIEQAAPEPVEPAPPIEAPKKAEPVNIVQDEPVDQHEQIQEDADATGMTSRMPDATETAGEDQPGNAAGH